MVGCAPVPNARPGSMTTGRAPGGGSSQGGPTQSGPISTPWWKARQRSSHPPATSEQTAPGKAAATRRADSPYAASSTSPSPPASSNPSGASSTKRARRISAWAIGTLTAARISGTRS